MHSFESEDFEYAKIWGGGHSPLYFPYSCTQTRFGSSCAENMHFPTWCGSPDFQRITAVLWPLDNLLYLILINFLLSERSEKALQLHMKGIISSSVNPFKTLENCPFVPKNAHLRHLSHSFKVYLVQFLADFNTFIIKIIRVKP